MPSGRAVRAAAEGSRREGDATERRTKSGVDNTLGGDIYDCLSAKDIDKILGNTILVPAGSFYYARHAEQGYDELATRLRKATGLLIIHTRHHWLAASVTRECTTFYDSARSRPVERDMRALARTMGWQKLKFATCPQQQYGTNECGIFAILNVLLLHEGVSIPERTDKVSLYHLRDMLARGQSLDRSALVVQGKKAYRIIRQGHDQRPSGGARQATALRCAGCGDWIQKGTKCHQCKKKLCACGTWCDEKDKCARCEPATVDVTKSTIDESKQPSAPVPTPSNSSRSSSHGSTATEDDLDAKVSRWSGEPHQNTMALFQGSLSDSAPGSGPNEWGRPGQDRGRGGSGKPTSAGDDSARQIDTRHAPTNVGVDRRDAAALATHERGNGNLHTADGGAHKQKMDVGNHAQEPRKHAGCVGAAADVPQRRARDLVETRCDMGGDHARGNERGTRGGPKDAKSNVADDIQQDTRGGTRCRKTGGTSIDVAYGGAGGVHPSTGSRRSRLEQRQLLVGDVPAREGREAAWAVHSTHDGHSRTAGDDRTLCNETADDWTPLASLPSQDQGHACNLSTGRREDGGTVDTTGVAANIGGRRGAELNTDELQRPHKRANAEQVSQLGTLGGGNTHSDGGGWKSITTNIKGEIPQWAALRGKEQRVRRGKLPLHAKDVVNSVDQEKLKTLSVRPETAEELKKALNWTTPSVLYEILRDELKKRNMRTTSCAFEKEHVELMNKLGKLVEPTDAPLAFCNGFVRTEEREEGDRLRPLLEPVINDIIDELAKIDPRFDVSTKYATKDEIRSHVYHSECAAQFDFAAWYDQIEIAKAIRKFFSVDTVYGIYVLACLAMGFKPSCRVAQAFTNVIREVKAKVFSDSCVDNVAFMGSREEVIAAAQEFIQRADTVGAQIKDRTIRLTTEYDFLGEHYNHERKTRCLTEKVRAKAQYVVEVLREKRSLTTKQLQAIYGLLIYAAGTLRITLARFHWALRFMAVFGGTDAKHLHDIPAGVRIELARWSQEAATNTPVPVWTPEQTPEYVIYTDASATGWGAWSYSRGGNAMSISQPWTESDATIWNLDSSVSAEPLAVQKAVAALVPSTAKKVVIYTDHLPLVYAKQRTVGRAYSYSRMIQFLESYDTQFELRFVPGEQNPADVLSRANHPLTQKRPPILNVTAVGTKEKEGNRGTGLMG